MVMSMGVRSSLRLCCRTVRRARAVSMAVTQPTPCSTAERRIRNPSESCFRPRVGVLMTRSTVPEAIISRILGWAWDTRFTRLHSIPASFSASQVPEVA